MYHTSAVKLYIHSRISNKPTVLRLFDDKIDVEMFVDNRPSDDEKLLKVRR